MPKYTFECSECSTRFTRNLKMGEHPTNTCPSCGEVAPRLFEGFGFDFQEGKVSGNSGVSKQDYPTADQAVGRDAEKRWAELDGRGKVKDEVRRRAGSHALSRKQGVEGGKPYVEYSSTSDQLIDVRRKLVKEAKEAYSQRSDDSTS